MPKEILNGIEYGNGIDHQKLLKIGDAPLDTTADNLSDAVNELKSALSQLAKKEWTMIEEAGDTAQTVNITSYNEVLLLFQRVSDGAILATSNVSVSLATIVPVYAIFFDGHNIFLGRLYDNGSKLISNNSNYKALLYAR